MCVSWTLHNAAHWVSARSVCSSEARLRASLPELTWLLAAPESLQTVAEEFSVLLGPCHVPLSLGHLTTWQLVASKTAGKRVSTTTLTVLRNSAREVQ